MHLLFLLLAPVAMAKHYHHHHRKPTKSTFEPRSEQFTQVTVTATAPALYTTTTILSPSAQLRTRDSGDLRTFKGRTRTVHVATTTTLPVIETFTATPSPSLLTTTETVTVTETASPWLASSSVIAPGAHRPITTTISSNLQTLLADKCYDVLGGLQTNGTVTLGCGGMLAHIQTCYNAYEPGGDPVNSDQNYVFQACMCGTSKDHPFTSDNLLYRNYTSCAACLLSLNLGSSEYIYNAAQELWNFCRSQNPLPYLFFNELSNTLGQPQLRLSDHFIPSPALTLPAPIAVSTTPPLANLAYGASAPPDGSLAKVTPSLTTYTTLITKTSDNSIVQETITSLAAWVPTQVGKAWNAASASRSEAIAVSSRLASDICKDRQLRECPQNHGTRKRIECSGLLVCAVLVALLQLR